ncbi:MarR family winged helix-turn-helix transcriptional regulator [Undibacter mobilis]|uniref:MarR family transcriptional regulator n=1 Tax=Undibacter mobilis TaxID=2292256 RepID=A0A371BAM9_9BRAD|nr:MarR family winged helix-turn-helix transcriptional regulator [Undibacter mobilis]RDV04656.1 MarR family transcriptional regulator [Undibacter mobilis]
MRSNNLNCQEPDKRAQKAEESVVDWCRPASVSADTLLIDGTDGCFLTMIYNLWAFNQHMEAARNSLAKHFELSGPQYTIFMAIARFEGQEGINARDLSKLLQVSPGFIATEIKSLVSLGLLTKSIDGRDRRMHRLQTSDQGRKLLRTNSSFVCKMNDLLFGGLTSEEVQQLVTLSSKLTHQSERTSAILDTHYKMRGEAGQN